MFMTTNLSLRRSQRDIAQKGALERLGEIHAVSSAAFRRAEWRPGTSVFLRRAKRRVRLRPRRTFAEQCVVQSLFAERSIRHALSEKHDC